jgi:hypothetical protein
MICCFRLMRVSARTITLISLTALGACDSSGAGSAEGFVEAYCSIMDVCCERLGVTTGGSNACRGLFGFAASFAEYDAGKGKACLEAARAAQDQNQFCTGASPDVKAACDDVFESAPGNAGSTPHGDKRPGDPCTDDLDCALDPSGEVRCDRDYVTSPTGGSTEMRACRLYKRGTPGATPCLGTRDGNFTSYSGLGSRPFTGYLCDLADGVACNQTSGACEALVDVGGACDLGRTCKKGAYCAGATCTARTPVDGACDPTDFGADRVCVDGAFCDREAMACKAERPEGAACTDSAQCAGSCVNGKCNGRSGLDDLGSAILCASGS